MTLEELKGENARLKAEVDNSNRINTELLLLSNKQASEVRRLTAELSNISGWGRGLESDLSHARVEISFLKAEVERLTERNKFLEQIDSYLQGANENAYEKRCDELEAEVEELKRMLEASTFGIEFAKEDIKKLEAEVERLTEDNRQLKKVFEIAEGIIKRMGNDAENAAKEGKQP